MQKALTQMNIQLANVISDVAGASDQRILRTIVAGERDGQALASLKDARIHASTDETAKSPARQLARRAPVRAETGAGRVRLLLHPAGRVRRRHPGPASGAAGSRRYSCREQEAQPRA
jgi:hypothetical protein